MQLRRLTHIFEIQFAKNDYLQKPKKSVHFFEKITTISNFIGGVLWCQLQHCTSLPWGCILDFEGYLTPLCEMFQKMRELYLTYLFNVISCKPFGVTYLIFSPKLLIRSFLMIL